MKVTLKTIPLYKTLAHNYIVSDEILTNGTVIQMARETDQMTLYWFPAVNEVVVGNWTRVGVNTPGEAFTFDHVPPTYADTAAASAAFSDATFNLTSSTCPLANSVGKEFNINFNLVTQTFISIRIYNSTYNCVFIEERSYRGCTRMGTNLYHRWLHYCKSGSWVKIYFSSYVPGKHYFSGEKIRQESTAYFDHFRSWIILYTRNKSRNLVYFFLFCRYYDLMIAPVCTEEPSGKYNAACLWCHGPDNNMTILDHE